MEKSWQQREETLKSQEAELASMRKTVEGYPANLQKEIDKAVAEAIRRTEQKLAHEIELLKRDSDSEKRIAELKIKTLEESLLRQLAQANSMQEQLEEAKKASARYCCQSHRRCIWRKSLSNCFGTNQRASS